MSTFAVKIVKITFDEYASKRSVDPLGTTDAGVAVPCGDKEASNPSDCGEKNPLI